MSDQLSLFDQLEEADSFDLPLIQELEPIPLNKDLPTVQLPDLVPEGALFALNRGYSADSVHIGRILRLVSDQRHAGEPITREGVAEQLGMTWAASQGTMNVMRRAELLDSQTQATPFGELALATSPYLDDLGLLWLLHYILASNALLVLWSNVFNLVFFERQEATIQEASETFRVLEGRWSAKTIHEKARNELGGIVKTYTDDLFRSLGILVKSEVGVYQSLSNTANIPPLIWLSAVLVYRDRYYSGAASLEVPLIVRGHFAPGRIFRQNEVAVRQALDALHNAGLLTVETRSGLDQVRFKRDPTWLSAIAQHLSEDGGA